MHDRPVVVVGTLWCEPNAELAYATRSLAAAASQWTAVSVLVPGEGSAKADGAFDLVPIGSGADTAWWDDLPSDPIVVVDHLNPDTAALLRLVGLRDVYFLGGSSSPRDPSWQQLSLTPGTETDPFVTIHVPVNRQAEEHRHNAFGFTGYELVLSDRTGAPDGIPDAAAWLTAAFHDTEVIVVEDAVASAWRGRALRGTATVDSRMDLWRLMAHANACIDLAPGRALARECVEALRFGTPIVVPAGSGPAAAHAAAGGGATFSDPEELLTAVGTLRSPDIRAGLSRRGRQYADSTYGDPGAVAARARAVLAGGAPAATA